MEYGEWIAELELILINRTAETLDTIPAQDFVALYREYPDPEDAFEELDLG